jgi:hypothetical protein
MKDDSVEQKAGTCTRISFEKEFGTLTCKTEEGHGQIFISHARKEARGPVLDLELGLVPYGSLTYVIIWRYTYLTRATE